MLWSSIPNSIEHIKINERLRKSLYNWILQNLQVVKYTIANDCHKISIDGPSESQSAPKCLLQVCFRELRKSMVSTPEEIGLKESKYADNSIIISDFTLQSILPHQLKNMSAR